MRRGFWVGALFGAAVCLWYGTPAARFWPCSPCAAANRGTTNGCFLARSSVLLPFSGVLDAITWGAAFQSIWLNFEHNSLEGIAAAIGTQGPDYYMHYFIVAFLPLPLFLGLAVVGAVRFPPLAIAALATLVMHNILPHKEVRFIYLTLAAMPILIGLGTTHLSRLIGARHGRRAVLVGVAAFLTVTAVLSCYIATGPLVGRWSFQRGMVHAFLAANREPDLCGFTGSAMFRSGGAGATPT